MTNVLKRDWVLRSITAGLTLQWLGFTWEAFQYQTAIDQLFFQAFRMTDTKAHAIDVGLCFLALLSSLVLFFFFQQAKVKIAAISGLLLSTLLWAAGHWYSQPDPLSSAGVVSMLEACLRWSVPLLLLLDRPWCIGLGTLALSLTFFGHGLEALAGQGEFLDFLIDFMETTFQMDFNESWARAILSVIATWDLTLAMLVLAYPRRAWLWATTFWGFTTSLERVLYWGIWQGTALFLQRATHWVVPLAIAKYHQENPNNEEL